MKRKLIALVVTFILLLQVLATPVFAIEEIIEETIKENSQLKVTEEKQEELVENLKQEEVEENIEIKEEKDNQEEKKDTIVANTEPVETPILKDPLDEEVNIPDEEFRGIILSKLILNGRIKDPDKAESHIITVADMQSIEMLELHDIWNYTGLEYATNLTSLHLENYYETAFDCTLVQNMPNLTALVIGGRDNGRYQIIENVQVLDNLENLKLLEIGFDDQLYLNNCMDELKKLHKSDDLLLIIDQFSEAWEPTLDEIIAQLDTLEVKKIIYNEMIRNLPCNLPVIKGTTTEIPFEKLSSILRDYILNPESKFYRTITEISTEDAKISVDNEKKLIQITSSNEDNCDLYNAILNISYYTNDEEQAEASIECWLNYKIVLDGDTTADINIPDPNFKAQLLAEHDVDGDKRITQFDMNNIRYLHLIDVADFTGLENAQNLQELNLESEQRGVRFDFSILDGMNNLTYLEIRHIKELSNAHNLNLLNSLENVNLTFNNPNAIQELEFITDTDQFTIFLKLVDNSDDKLVYQVAQFLENCPLENIRYHDLYKDIEVGDPIVIGTSTGPMDYTEYPIFGEFVLKEGSKFYNQNFKPYTYSDNVIFNNTNKTLEIKSNESDTPGRVSTYVYYNDIYGDERDFRITYTLIPDGDYDSVVDIPDPELHRYLCDNYDVSGNGEMSPGEMQNITYLRLGDDIHNFEGLQYAINLQTLYIENDHGNDVEFDLSYIQDMSELTNFELTNVNSLTNCDGLNGLTSLTKVNIRFSNVISLLNSITELRKINRPDDLTLFIGLGITPDDPIIDNVATELETLNVKGIFLYELLRQAYLQESIPVGKSRVFTFDEVNPFLNKYLLNPESKFYISNQNFIPSTNDALEMDMANKTIKVKSRQNDQVESKLEWFTLTYESMDYMQYISYEVVIEGDHDTEIPIPDSNLKSYLLNNCDADHNDKITEYDMINIKRIFIGNMENLEGLQYAINLQEFSVSGAKIELLGLEVLGELKNLQNLSLHGVNNIDCSILSRITNLKQLNISRISNISNVSSLNSLTKLRRLDLSFINKDEIQKLIDLNDHDGLELVIGLNNEDYSIPVPAEDISQIVEWIEDFNVTNILFKNIIQDCSLGYLDVGKQIEITLEDISPWFNYMKTNTTSKLYQPNLEVNEYLPSDINIKYDREKEKITLITDETHTGNFYIDFDVTYEITENSLYTMQFRVDFKVMATGDKNKEVIVNDPNLRKILIENYNYDNNEMISEFDMYNIEELYTEDLEITDLAGLEFAKNLKKISIYNGKISDFSPIRNLDGITSFNVSNYDVEGAVDFSAIGNLNNMHYFWLTMDKEFDMKLLQNKPELNNISLSASRIFNMSSLNELTKLNSIYITVNEINGLEGLKDLSLTANNTTLNITINNYNINNPYSDEQYNELINALKGAQIDEIKVNFSQMIVDLGDILVSDEPYIVNFKDINPIVNAMIDEGPLHRDNISLYKKDNYYSDNNNNDLVVDQENKQLIFNITNAGENTVVLQLGNEETWKNNEYPIEINGIIKIRYNVIFDGNKTKLYDENDIPDENFRRILEERYNADGEPGISEYDMKNIAELYMWSVQDLTGIEYAANLKKLYLDAYNSSDLTKLQSLTKLDELEIDINEENVNLMPIVQIPNLKKLSLYYYGSEEKFDVNQVICNMPNLEKISIQFLQSTISGLSELTNLKELEIYMPKDGNLTPITSCINLERLLIRNIDRPIDYNIFNTLPINDLELEFLNAQAIAGTNGGLDVLDNTRFVTNIRYYPRDVIEEEEEQIFLNEIAKVNGRSGFRINFGIYKILANIVKNTVRVYPTYQDFDKILGETLNPKSILYNASIRTYEYMDNDISINTDEHTLTLTAPNEVSEKSSNIYISGNNINGNVGVRYRVITDEGSTAKIYDENDIPDENLRKVLEEKYNVDGQQGFSERDMLNLTELDLYEANVKDLTGLQYADNLLYVYAGGNNIRSIVPLMELENIVFIDVNDNSLTDITCLSQSKSESLTDIYVSGNFIDFSNGSQNLKVLEEFMNPSDAICNVQIGYTIASQKVGDPSHFDDPVTFGDANVEQRLIEMGVKTNADGKMTRRTLYEASVEDRQSSLAPGWGMGATPSEPILRRLNLDNMNISDLSGFEYLGQIEELILSNNNISDIKPLKYLAGLKDLDLSHNNISDLSPLSNYIGALSADDEGRILNYRFAFNNISNIAPLSTWKILTSTFTSFNYGPVGTYRVVSIDLAENNISSIAGVENWKNLCWLDLASNNISDITNLKNYNFTVWPEASEYMEKNSLIEQLERFNGIQLINQRDNSLDLNAQGTKDSKAAFDAKNVKLILEEEQQPQPDYKLGDVNNDGKINQKDAKLALKAMANKVVLTEEQRLAADVNHDNKVNQKDAKLILKYMAGKITEF